DQEQGSGGDLLGGADPADRHRPGKVLRRATGHPEKPVQQRGVGAAGAQAVHPDALRAQLTCQRAGEQDDAALGGAVRLVASLALETGLRCRVQYDAMWAAAQVGERGPAGEEHGAQVGGVDAVPLGGLELRERHEVPAPRVVEENVETAEALDGALDHALDVLLEADVSAQERRLPSP